MLDPTMPRPAPGPGELGVIFAQPDARHALLVVEGEIDTLTTAALERALSKLLSDASDVLVVDLADVTFLASSGLAVLIRAAHQAGERRLRLVAARAPSVARWRSPDRISSLICTRTAKRHSPRPFDPPTRGVGR